jgi:hypothetical protein
MNSKHRTRSGSWYSNLLNISARTFGLFIFSIIMLEVYQNLIASTLSGNFLWGYIVIWVLSAYVVLPRIYKLLSWILLPDYFIGRTQTSAGLLGDPVNIAFNGTKEQLIHAMEAAGWVQATPLTIASSLRIIYAAVRGTNYPDAPVSALFLFNRRQDFAFQKDINGNPRRRHHIRFWKTPEEWWLPGGYQADWLAAATFDKNVGLSLFTGQITHKIDANIDEERDFVIQTLRDVNAIHETKLVKHFTSSYRSRNGGGDVIHTDGTLPFITLQ